MDLLQICTHFLFMRVCRFAAGLFFWKQSIMPLVFVGPGFAEPGGEGRRLAGSIEMGDIAEGEHAEVGDAGTAFLCDDCGDGGWCGTGAVPQKHR